jgi:hypothetical protein
MQVLQFFVTSIINTHSIFKILSLASLKMK